MCQYSCEDGLANDWHFVHLGSRAVGGAGLVMTEAAAVTPEGRISLQDLGVWSEAHFELLEKSRASLARRARSRHSARSCGAQSQHDRPWSGSGAVPDAEGGWHPVGPSALAFAQNYTAPRELAVSEIHSLRGRVRNRGAARVPRRVPRDRNPRRAWRSPGRVPVAAQQPTHGRLWRSLREPHALPA